MSADRAARGALARAIRSHTQRNIETARREMHYAVVRQATPLQVEIEGRGIVLDEDDLVVTQWVRRYGYEFGLSVGDTVLVTHMPNDDFVVHDVVSTAKIETGLDDGTRTGVSHPARNGTIVAEVPYLNADGTVLGVVPVYNAIIDDPGGTGLAVT